MRALTRPTAETGPKRRRTTEPMSSDVALAQSLQPSGFLPDNPARSSSSAAARRASARAKLSATALLIRSSTVISLSDSVRDAKCTTQ